MITNELYPGKVLSTTEKHGETRPNNVVTNICTELRQQGSNAFAPGLLLENKSFNRHYEIMTLFSFSNFKWI